MPSRGVHSRSPPPGRSTTTSASDDSGPGTTSSRTRRPPEEGCAESGVPNSTERSGSSSATAEKSASSPTRPLSRTASDGGADLLGGQGVERMGRRRGGLSHCEPLRVPRSPRRPARSIECPASACPPRATLRTANPTRPGRHPDTGSSLPSDDRTGTGPGARGDGTGAGQPAAPCTRDGCDAAHLR